MRGAALVALLAVWAGGLAAQVPGEPAARRPRAQLPTSRDSTRTVRPDSLRRDTTAAGRDTTAAGRGRGLPQRPSREFAPPDSVTTALLAREGYRITRYAADSVQFLAQDKEIRLAGRSLVQRDQSTLEADTVRYIESNCEMQAAGSPRLYDENEVVVGEGMRYDACNKTGIIRRANTEYPEGSMEGQGGIQSGLTPVVLSSISAMCPPSTRVVRRMDWSSTCTALRPRNIVSFIVPSSPKK
jgi:hypothetical protein